MAPTSEKIQMLSTPQVERKGSLECLRDPRNRLIYHLRGLLDGLPLECCSSEILEKSLKTGRNTPENAVYFQNHSADSTRKCNRWVDS